MNPNPQARLIFTAGAFFKMRSLVDACPTEVAWHGLVQKVGAAAYRVYDILCFPQYASGGATTTDQQEYQRWLFEQPLDAPLCLHGHSHVRMPAFSSSRDDAYQQEILKTLSPQEFYIFHITNKQGDNVVLIHDNAASQTWRSEKGEISLEVEEAVPFLTAALDQVRPLSQLPHTQGDTPLPPEEFLPAPASASGFTWLDDDDYDDDWLHWEAHSLQDPFARNEV